MTSLHQQLQDWQSSLPGLPFVSAVPVFDHDFTLAVDGGMAGLLDLARTVQPKVIFYVLMTLTPESLTYSPADEEDKTFLPQPELDLSGEEELQPFLKHVGEAHTLMVYFLYESHRFTCSVCADWLSPFEQARDQAYQRALQQRGERQQAQQGRKQAEREQRREVFVKKAEVALKADPEFRRLSCEVRPRVTDLYRQAENVLDEDEWYEFGGGIFSAEMRRIAAEIKEEARAERKARGQK